MFQVGYDAALTRCPKPVIMSVAPAAALRPAGTATRTGPSKTSPANTRWESAPVQQSVGRKRQSTNGVRDSKTTQEPGTGRAGVQNSTTGDKSDSEEEDSDSEMSLEEDSSYDLSQEDDSDEESIDDEDAEEWLRKVQEANAKKYWNR